MQLDNNSIRQISRLSNNELKTLEAETIADLRKQLQIYNRGKSQKEVASSIKQMFVMALIIFAGILAVDKTKKVVRRVIVLLGVGGFIMGFMKNRTHIKELNRYENDPHYAGENYAVKDQDHKKWRDSPVVPIDELPPGYDKNIQWYRPQPNAGKSRHVKTYIDENGEVVREFRGMKFFNTEIYTTLAILLVVVAAGMQFIGNNQISKALQKAKDLIDKTRL